MNSRTGRTVIAILIICTSGSAVWGQEAEPRAEVSAATGTAQDASKSEGRIGAHFQIGLLGRLATNVSHETKESYLVTGDLTILRWSREKSTFGGGVHFSMDGDGHRLGLKGIWRTPLKKGTGSYFQVAPGVFISGTDDTYDFRAPSLFLEAEVGLCRSFALVLAAESVRYRHREVGIVQTDTWGRWTRVYEDGTATTLFGGGKIGQLPALGATLMGAIVGVIVLASLASSDGFM